MIPVNALRPRQPIVLRAQCTTRQERDRVMAETAGDLRKAPRHAASAVPATRGTATPPLGRSAAIPAMPLTAGPAAGLFGSGTGRCCTAAGASPSPQAAG